MSKRNFIFKGLPRFIGSNHEKREDCRHVIREVRKTKPNQRAPFTYSIHDIDTQIKLLAARYTGAIEYLRKKLHEDAVGKSEAEVEEMASDFERRITDLKRQADAAASKCMKRYIKVEQHHTTHQPHQSKRECLSRMMKITHGYYHNQPVIHVEGQ